MAQMSKNSRKICTAIALMVMVGIGLLFLSGVNTRIMTNCLIEPLPETAPSLATVDPSSTKTLATTVDVLPKSCSFGRYVDYVEIGTSDFKALAHEVDVCGLSVEMIKEYADGLPLMPDCNIIENVAITTEDGQVTIPIIDPEKKNELSSQEQRGISTLRSGGHPQVFRNKNLQKLLINRTIRTITWNSLMEQTGIGRIGVLKVDTEGFEPVILNQTFNWAEKTNCWPISIRYEHVNGLANKKDLKEVKARLENMYNCYRIERSFDDICFLNKFGSLQR